MPANVDSGSIDLYRPVGATASQIHQVPLPFQVFGGYCTLNEDIISLIGLLLTALKGPVHLHSSIMQELGS